MGIAFNSFRAGATICNVQHSPPLGKPSTCIKAINLQCKQVRDACIIVEGQLCESRKALTEEIAGPGPRHKSWHEPARPHTQS